MYMKSDTKFIYDVSDCFFFVFVFFCFVFLNLNYLMFAQSLRCADNINNMFEARWSSGSAFDCRSSRDPSNPTLA